MFTRPPPKMSVEVLERAKEWRKRQTEEREAQELDLNNLPPGYEVCQDGDPEMWWGDTVLLRIGEAFDLAVFRQRLKEASSKVLRMLEAEGLIPPAKSEGGQP